MNRADWCPVKECPECQGQVALLQGRHQWHSGGRKGPAIGLGPLAFHVD